MAPGVATRHQGFGIVAASSCGDMAIEDPLVVVGSVNADIYVEIERLPIEGETIAATSGQTLPGGKGANQAACAARLGYPTYFCGQVRNRARWGFSSASQLALTQVGDDANAGLVKRALASAGVRLDHVTTVAGPTGHAVVMLQPSGTNSIIIVGGANIAWPTLEDGTSRLTADAHRVIQHAGAVLLQREIPDVVNLEAAKLARSANVPVIMDVGGADGPIPEELLECVTVLSPNESELARLTGMATGSADEILLAAAKVQEMGVKQVLVKMGENGSVLVRDQEPPLFQSAILAPTVVDTTGAGDTFTAAYAVAVIQRQSPEEALRFAAASASICVGAKGASPSVLGREVVLERLKEHPVAEDVRVRKGARALLYGTGPRSGVSLSVRGGGQRSARMPLGAGAFLRTALSGGASPLHLPCEILPRKSCPLGFGVFAL